MNLDRARELRKNATDCERVLWLHLRAGRFKGFKFKRQQPLGQYIVDFVCLQTRLIVEADGGQHADQAEYDAQRDDWLKNQGFRVLRFWNNEILTNTEGVLETILKACLDAPPPAPRRGRATSVDCVQDQGSGTDLADLSHAASKATEQPSSPLPSRERGWGRGGESR